MITDSVQAKMISSDKLNTKANERRMSIITLRMPPQNYSHISEKLENRNVLK